MSSFAETSIWRQSLATRKKDVHKAPRERLRNSYLQMRERVSKLVAEIARDLPNYTVHDISHLDALWEYCSIIAGPQFELTPSEAFVLGGAILLHDAGMSVSSYPNGKADLKRDEMWEDIVAHQFVRLHNRMPSSDELANPPVIIENASISELLRLRHAQQANLLATGVWHDASGASHRLIDDEEVRSSFGPAIGVIASSHWWPIEQVRRMLDEQRGSAHFLPLEWTLDMLLPACLLRLGDVSHIDARRAPSFLRAIRELNDESDEHWAFQSRLERPSLKNGRLYYRSSCSFLDHEASAWWLAYDALQMIDKELRQTDELLRETRDPKWRLAARGVAHVADPLSAMKSLPCTNWTPSQANVKISNVPKLVEKLGGSQLYGDDPFIALRELIQNARDAIQARRLIEGRDDNWGLIEVSLNSSESRWWIDVADNGIGMSEEVICEELLNFGGSYRGSQLMRREFPGLYSKNLSTVGRYGIGFFSSFMLGNRVEVITRRARAAADETITLIFSRGLSWRPLLKKGFNKDLLLEGGTIVRVYLDSDPLLPGGLCHHEFRERADIKDFNATCANLCPAIDVSVNITDLKKNSYHIEARDWITADIRSIASRISEGRPSHDDDLDENKLALIELAASNARPLMSESGEIVGRAAILPSEPHTFRSLGMATIGGLSSAYISGIYGVIAGRSRTVARDAPQLLPSAAVLKYWSSEQAELIAAAKLDANDEAGAASVVWCFGGNMGPLRVAESKDGWVRFDQLYEYAQARSKIVLIHDAALWIDRRRFRSVKLLDGVLAVGMGAPVLMQRRNWDADDLSEPISHAIIQEVMRSWGENEFDLSKLSRDR